MAYGLVTLAETNIDTENYNGTEKYAGAPLLTYRSIRAVYTKRQRQRCDNVCDTSLIDHNGVTPKWAATPFSSNSIVVNERCVASIIAVLMLTLGVNRA